MKIEIITDPEDRYGKQVSEAIEARSYLLRDDPNVKVSITRYLDKATVHINPDETKGITISDAIIIGATLENAGFTLCGYELGKKLGYQRYSYICINFTSSDIEAVWKCSYPLPDEDEKMDVEHEYVGDPEDI